MSDFIVSEKQFIDWNETWKRKNYFAGLAFFNRTSSRLCFNIISRHWPHLLCWSWLISVDFGLPRSWMRFGFYHVNKRHFGFRLPFMHIGFQSQPETIASFHMHPRPCIKWKQSPSGQEKA